MILKNTFNNILLLLPLCSEWMRCCSAIATNSSNFHGAYSNLLHRCCCRSLLSTVAVSYWSLKFVFGKWKSRYRCDSQLAMGCSRFQNSWDCLVENKTKNSISGIPRIHLTNVWLLFLLAARVSDMIIKTGSLTAFAT